MYECPVCGSQNPDHACPGRPPSGNASTNPDFRANELRRFDETEAEWRRRRVQEMQEEGLCLADIAAKLDLQEGSVRSILRKLRLEVLEEPLSSSLAKSLTNHTPSEADLERIKEIRHAADDLCSVIDRVCLDSRETSLAKTHLEETVMWAVKSLVLPRENTEVRQ